MRGRPIFALLATAVVLFVPSVAGVLVPDVVRAALVGVGLLLLPGAMVAEAAGLEFEDVADRLATAFTFSLALLVPGLLLALASGTGVTTVVAVLFLTCALLATRIATRRPIAVSGGKDERRDDERAGLPLFSVTVVTTIALTVAAVVVTRTGSVDRWWYLGYVRAWMHGPLFAHEPFLGTGFVQPRFALHTWLGALSVWSRLAAVDPLWLFDRACPALLMPLAFAAQAAFGRTLFRSARGACLTALCAGLLWAGGGPIAALTRLPEDKVLAAVVLAPMLWSFGLRACERGGSWTVATALAAVSVATIHPLGFLLSAGPLAAFCALRAWHEPQTRSVIAGVALVLVAGSAYPLVSGFAVRRAYVNDGAAALGADHPVARVHRSRQRLVAVGNLGYVVDPRLLAHPIIWVALAGLPILRRRSSREATFLAPAALIPLAIAFVPLLADAAGAVILPWMVHRVLWAIPFAALAAVTAEECAVRLGGRSGAVAAALVLLSMPWARSAAIERMRAEREALALPATPQLHEALAALRALPANVLVAAAPELSERITGLTGAHVLAMSDRATIVFAGARAAGEARLRERASLFAGVWKPADDAPTPTHVLFAPGAIASRYCGTELLRNDRFVLCTFSGADAPSGSALPEVPAQADGSRRVSIAVLLAEPVDADGRSQAERRGTDLTAHCEPQPRLGVPGTVGLTRARGGPWSPEFPLLSCTVERSTGDLLARTVVMEPALGTAVDELMIEATGFERGAELWHVQARRRAHNGDTLRFGLPRTAVDRMVIQITPSFLPFVKLRGFELTFEGQGEP